MKAAKNCNPELILHGNLIRAILSLAIPVVINSFLQTMYNLTDTYWLGKIGTEQLAAINLVTPMQNIITNFGSGITVAGAVLIAQFIGAGEKEDARSMANQIFVCAMGFAVVCAALCFLGTPAIVNWLGADGGTAYYARVYLRVVIWDMPFLYMVNIFSAVHQAQGDTVRPMFLNLGGITLNLFLDPFFMIFLNLGTAGAEYGCETDRPCRAGISFFYVDIGCIFIHRWYDLIKRCDLHGDRPDFFEGRRGRRYGGGFPQCDGVLVLYQRCVQYDVRTVSGHRAHGGHDGD